MKTEKRSTVFGRFASGLAVVSAFLHLLILTGIPIDMMVYRALHLLIVTVLVVDRFPFSRTSRRLSTLIDTVMVLIMGAATLYFVRDPVGLVRRATLNPLSLDVIFGVAAITVTLEIARRTLGNAISLVGLIMIIYALCGAVLPGALNHRGFSLRDVGAFLFGPLGIYGTPLNTASTYILLFLVLSAFLRISGAGDSFMELAKSLTGHMRGGPAKVAVVSSALFGTISGSTTANVLTTGTFTIPMMKKTGYDADFAGAVEVVASAGGQIMPPIMGAAAFLMAENLGVPYTRIIRAALLPAILYFVYIFVRVHLEAVKMDLKGLDRRELPQLRHVLRRSWNAILPIGLLLFTILVLKRTVIRGALISIVAAIIAAQFDREVKMGWREILGGLESGMKAVVTASTVCAAAGIIIGVFYMTGLGVKMAVLLMEFSRGLLPVALTLIMFSSLILGMGLPTTACYLIPAAVFAPALVRLGVLPIAAHMFVFYFACMSTITPPVALGVYAAAPIADAPFWDVAKHSISLGVVAFLIPYMFVFQPALLLEQGSFFTITRVFLTALIGAIALGAGFSGFLSAELTWWERVALIGSGLLLIDTHGATDLVGALICGALYASQRFRLNKKL